MIHEYQLDLPGIAEFGIDQWLVKFKPIFKRDKFQQIYDKTLQAYADAMATMDKGGSVYWAAAVNCKIVNIISICFYQYLCLTKLKEQDVVTLTGKGDIDSVINEILTKSILRKNCQVSYQISLLKYIKEKVLFSRQNRQTNDSRTKECVVLGYADEPLLKSFILAENLKPVFQRVNLFLPLAKQNLGKDDLVGVEQFVNDFFAVIETDKTFFSQQLKEDLKKLFAETVAGFNYIKRQLSGRNLLPLVIGHMHNGIARMIGAAWQAAGGEVTGVAHGNVIFTGAYGQPMINGTLLICNRFLACSVGQQMQLEKIRMKNSGPLIAEAEIFVGHNRELQQVYDENREFSPVKDINSVMVVGYPMDYMGSPFLKGHEALTYAHMTLQILKILREAGYKLIYKAHPDTMSETAGFFDQYVDQVLEEDFTEVYTQADCLFYISPYTTSFGFGALTNKPMVYVNLPDWKWDEEILPLLEKRAVALTVAFDDEGVIQVDQETLLNSIRDSVSHLDFAVVEKYTFERSENGK